MEIQKVLWPTDFSDSSRAALPYIRSLVAINNAEIHVLHVMEDVFHHEGWYGEFDKEHIEKLMEKAGKKAEERLAQICDRHLEGCPLFIRHVAVGEPAAEILRLVEKEKMDTVVMSSRGKTGTFNFGSITDRVVKNAPVPVTVIPAQ